MGFTAAQQSASGSEGMTQNLSLAALSAAGVSVWLDDLSRNLLQSGKLQQLIDTRSVVGVTTNPSTFERALTHGRAYDGQIAELTARDTDIHTASPHGDHRRRPGGLRCAAPAVGGLRRCRRKSLH
jgi:hypothetical protein